jgi:hypothetical protein
LCSEEKIFDLTMNICCARLLFLIESAPALIVSRTEAEKVAYDD